MIELCAGSVNGTAVAALVKRTASRASPSNAGASIPA